MKDRKRICAPSTLGDLGRYAPVRALKLEQALIMTKQIYDKTRNEEHTLLVKNSSAKHHLITFLQRQKLFLHPQDP